MVFLLFVLLVGCGVKSPPICPPNTEIPAYEEKFKKPIIKPYGNVKEPSQKTKNKKEK